MIRIERKTEGVFLSEQGKTSTKLSAETETEKLWEFFALFVGEPEFEVDSVSYLNGKIEGVSTWK